MHSDLALPTELTIYTVGELRPILLDWLADPSLDRAADCVLDATAVEQIDAAGVQLLMSLAASLAREQRPLRLVNASAPLTAACAALGVAAVLGSAAAQRAAA